MTKAFMFLLVTVGAMSLGCALQRPTDLLPRAHWPTSSIKASGSSFRLLAIGVKASLSLR